MVYFLVIAATMLFAYLSYEYYEKWFLKLKKKYESIKTANVKTPKHNPLPTIQAYKISAASIANEKKSTIYQRETKAHVGK